jgi:2,4-dienoyl-CoA reductase-like NADH-dependent reductase (Old Yellow Enzyme family)
MSALFTPITLRSVTARNRIWVAPMCQYSVENQDGVPTAWHSVHLGSFAVGGAGLVMTEATAVTADGRISPEDTGIWTDEQASAWAPIAAFIRAQGAIPAMQLAHAGRKASTWRPWSGEHGTVPESVGGWQPVAPSAVAFEGYVTPRALDASELQSIVAAFAEGARRAVNAGFELVEVHAAHGYLLHEFLSPLSNVRGDEYGGSLENRARIVLEVVRAVRAAVGESVPVFVRFSATDWAEGGWNKEDTKTVARWAEEAGADLFDISSGGLMHGVTIPLGRGYQVPLAAHVREPDLPVSAVGLITEAKHAEEIIATGEADAVMMAREFLRDPHFPLRAAAQLGVEVDYVPKQYLRAPYPHQA